MEKTQRIVGLLARPYLRKIQNDKYLDSSEWHKEKQKAASYGAKLLKNKFLGGFFGEKEKFLNLEEIAEGLFDLGIANSKSEGSEIVPMLLNTVLAYSDCSYIIFDITTNINGNQLYRIRRG